VAEYKNPNQPGAPQGNNQSLIVMMLVLATVFFATNYYKARHNPPVANPNSGAQTVPQAAPGAAAPAGPAAAVPSAAGAAAASVPVVEATAETTTVVENELYRITFSNRGADVTSWILKQPQYKDSNGRQLDLVHDQAAKEFGYPLSLYTYDAGLTKGLAQAMYVASATGTLASPATLSFTYSNGDVQVKKTFSFNETYVLHADVEVTKSGAPIRALLAWPGGFGDMTKQQDYVSSQIDVSRSGKEEHLPFKKVSGGGTLDGPFDWAGVSDPYFAAIFLPDNAQGATVATLNHQIRVDKLPTGSARSAPAPGSGKGAVDVPLVGAAVGDVSGHTTARIYVGPKAVEVLKGIHAADPNVTLEPLLDFGFFGIIGKWLFLALQWVHAHVVSNWGWAIVVLTVAINLVILPLRIKTMQSGLKMQRIQPQVDAVKAKYKNLKLTDPKRNDMQAEIMQLQKDNGVNMFGGCIPTLIQLPLLFAFLGMLPKVVELRQAHWLWLPDLSAADPYHILPILMVVSQFLVQFYTPSPGVDPQQQKMMAFMMPAFSGYITWNYASGLALYWAVGNLIGIAQQAVMNQTSLGREARELAAKRARRKSGQPATIQGKPVRR
jgi:YidC/Oxa1 family membrane protein insertase